MFCHLGLYVGCILVSDLYFGVWAYMFGVWTYLFGVWTYIFNVWTYILGEIMGLAAYRPPYGFLC